jgi:hypothetical protein
MKTYGDIYSYKAKVNTPQNAVGQSKLTEIEWASHVLPQRGGGGNLHEM